MARRNSFVMGWQQRVLLRLDETAEILALSKSAIMDRLATGELQAHHSSGQPGKRGLRITVASVRSYLEAGGVKVD